MGDFPDRAPQPRKTYGSLHVQTLEVQNIYSTGETDTTPKVQLIWDEYASDEAGMAQSDFHLKQVHRDVATVEGFESIAEYKGDKV